MKRELIYSFYDQFNTFLHRFRPPTIINEAEIRLIGLKRTGNHGITNWIIKQYGEANIAYLNAITAQHNPYRLYYNHFPNNRFSRDAFGKFSKKDLLFYSYEDQSLERIFNEEFEKKHDLYLGKSAKRYDVLILRDPFNLFASRLKMMSNENHKHQKKLIRKSSIDMWISYAQEFLGETNYLNQKKVFINYNQWFSDQDYRKSISQQLELEFSDIGLEKVKGQGGGSSFDQLNFTGKASQMKVLERWLNYKDDPRFINIFQNEKLWYYSEKIFGKIPETENLRNQVSLSN